MSTSALHTGAELVAKLYAQFPFAGMVTIMNDRYCAVTRAWVDGPFAKYFFDYLAARNDLAYRPRGNQCEHFALRAALEAVQLFSLDQSPQIPVDAESIAVAACAYKRADGAGEHEVNLWFVDGVWAPWEPQQRRFFAFAESERLTTCQIIVP